MYCHLSSLSIQSSCTACSIALTDDENMGNVSKFDKVRVFVALLIDRSHTPT